MVGFLEAHLYQKVHPNGLTPLKEGVKTNLNLVHKVCPESHDLIHSATP